jgi:hypothetical protein
MQGFSGELSKQNYFIRSGLPESKSGAREQDQNVNLSTQTHFQAGFN